MKESRFLKKEDCGKGVLLTMRSVEKINVAKEGAPEELKWCLHFDEVDKPLVLNSTNNQIIASITGSGQTEDWAGKKVVLYADPNISFGGKLIGGIRARAAKNQPAEAPPQNPKPAEILDEEVPF